MSYATMHGVSMTLFRRREASGALSIKLRKLRELFAIMGVKPGHIILPMLLSFVAAVLSGVGLALLLPLARGVTKGSFLFLNDVRFLGPCIRWIVVTFGLTPSSQTTFLIVVLFAVSAQLLYNVLAYGTHLLLSHRNSVMYERLSNALYKRYLSFGKQFFDRESQGKVQTVLSYPADMLLLMNAVQIVATSGFQVLVRFLVMVFISWPLALATLIVAPIIAIGARWKARGVIESSGERNRLTTEVGRERFNVLTGISLVKSYAGEQRMLDRYAGLQRQMRGALFRLMALNGLADPMQRLIVLFAFIAILAFGRVFLQQMNIDQVSSVAIFLFVAIGLLPRLGEVGRSSFTIAEYLIPAGEILNVFADDDKFLVPQGGSEFTGLTQGIAFRNLTFAYNEDRQILQELTFTVEKHASVALVGQSGSGKTTAVSLLLRLYDCPPNSILIDGKDIRSFTHDSLQRHMAYVSQEPILFNDTLRYNVTFGLDREVTDAELQSVAEQARIAEFINALPKKWETEVGDRGVRLSGGEKQRLSIARALLKNAQIIVFDEATSSLDSQTERLIQEAIDAALKGRTAIVIAHRLSTIRNCSKIVVLREGRIAEEGTLKGLLEQDGIFAALWNAQQFY